MTAVTNQNVEAAIRDAQAAAEQWLCGSPDRLAADEFYREMMRLMTLSTVKPGADPPGKYPPPDGRVPSFGHIDGGDLVYDDDLGGKLIKKAPSDPDADAVLCGFAAEFIHRGCVMPARLSEFIGNKLWNQSQAVARGRGRRPHTNSRRNAYILFAVKLLHERGFHQTTQSDSACSIIAKALARIGMPTSEQNVAKVWGQFSHLVESDILNRFL
jgi:hypothetical protein